MSSDLAARARKRAEESELALHRTDAALYRSLADRVDEQAEIIDHTAPIAYAAEEWFHGRISDDDLRATIANVLSQKGGE